MTGTILIQSSTDSAVNVRLEEHQSPTAATAQMFSVRLFYATVISCTEMSFMQPTQTLNATTLLLLNA